MNTTLALPGFADPVGEAQATFRAVLDAMARPGKERRAGERLGAPAPLGNATAAVLLTLVDNETPVWLDPAAAAARDWLEFHCGATITDVPGEAGFALAMSMPDLTKFPVGSYEAPETSATLIVQIPALGSGARFRLAGPGLREPSMFSAQGLPANFVAAWQQNHALFPRGIDMILCADGVLTALPRSVAIEEA